MLSITPEGGLTSACCHYPLLAGWGKKKEKERERERDWAMSAKGGGGCTYERGYWGGQIAKLNLYSLVTAEVNN